jgi:hypothetical protein
MRRFRFRLEKVERWRWAARKEARVALARALAEAAARASAREAAERELARADEHSPLGDPSPLPSVLKEFYSWRERLREDLLVARAREKEARERAAEAEAAHEAARAAHRLLEKLRLKRWSRWLEQARRDEQKFLDEVHLLRAARERGAATEEVGP